MGDYAVAGSAGSVDDGLEVAAATIPPQVLARWAAMASQRAYYAMLPQQVATTA